MAHIESNHARRILDVLLSVLNGESYPLNQITRTHLEKIIEDIDGQLETGWTGEGYTIWMDGVGPEEPIKSREERDGLLDEYQVYELTADLPIIEPDWN
jgi:hypothetical protein